MIYSVTGLSKILSSISVSNSTDSIVIFIAVWPLAFISILWAIINPLASL